MRGAAGRIAIVLVRGAIGGLVFGLFLAWREPAELRVDVLRGVLFGILLATFLIWRSLSRPRRDSSR